MQEPNKNQRTKLMREKIAELSKIDPNAHITKEELEEKKKKFWSIDRRAHISFRSENKSELNSAIQQREPPRPANVIKKIFAFDSNYYKNLNHIYERPSTKIEDAQVPPNRPILEQVNQQVKFEASKGPSKAEPSANFLRLVPVKNQESVQLPKLEPVQQKALEVNQRQEVVDQEPQKQNEQVVSKPEIVEKVEASKNPEANNQFEPKGGQEIPTTQPFSGKTQFSLFGKSTMGPTPFFGATNISPSFNLDAKKDQSSELKPVNIFGLGQNLPKTTEQNKPSLFFNPVKPATTTPTDQQKDETAKPAPKPLFSFPLKSDIIKSESQQFPSSQKPETKNIFSQTLNDKVEKKEVNITSIFDTSNQGALNLNPAKPATPPVTFGFLGNKATQEGLNAEKKPNPPPLSFLSSSQSNSSNKQAAGFLEPESKSKTPTNQEATNPAPAPTQTKALFSGIFSAPTKAENTSVPFFGPTASIPTTAATNMFSSSTQKTEQKPSLFPNFSQPNNPPAKNEQKPSLNINPFSANQTQGLFQKKETFLSAQTSLFSNSKPSTPFFQSTPATTTKVEPVATPVVEQTPSNNLPAIPEVKEELSRKQSERSQKKEKSLFTAIGPGGKKIEIQPLFPTDTSTKPNLFSSGSISNAASIFNQPPNTTNNLFKSSTDNFFAKTDNNIFGQNQAPIALNAVSMFNQPTNNIFGNAGNSIFSSNVPVGQNEEGGEGDSGDDGPLEAKDEANPNQSTGRYDYIQTQIFFKESANKFREALKDSMQNTFVSIQKFQGSEDRFLYVRMPNKRIAFCGKLLKNITEYRIMNNSSKNLQIKKILLSGEGVTQPQLSYVKIQLKDEATGDRFMKEIDKAIGKAS